jgi:hypothetical protein
MLTPSTQIFDAVTCFIKLTPLRDDPKHTRWVRDEFDLIEALEITRDYYHDTSRMVGKAMYVGEKEFDFTEDVKRAVEEHFLGHRDQSQVMVQRKHNITMYHLVIEPIIDHLSQLSHYDVLACAHQYFSDVINALLSSDCDPHMDDAVVARELVNMSVRERDAIRKAQKKQRKTKRPVVDDLPTEDIDD